MRPGRDGKKISETLDAELPDAVLKRLLWKAYNAFKVRMPLIRPTGRQ